MSSFVIVQERSKCHENATNLVFDKTDGVHLRVQHLSGMSRGDADSLYEWGQNGTEHERRVDDSTPAEILPQSGVCQIPDLLPVSAVGAERPALLHLWLRCDCADWLAAADAVHAV